ncbi:heterokaryon incompatibility protein-domain-containing protein [Cercophora newfieldiana]|uniref:Heterokaryon incompatibility protein-domain-containing protein n=1 Tax=Cercophora newfieldiana TaxID=92897 RepID=A0AA39XU84_9PEZI|nr:heterokaryon incompatibility protein-domain-containing protein [Cercophora newfieldiana]
MSPTTRHSPHAPLPPGSIRLLRVRPSQNREAALECQLFPYPLFSPPGGAHLYEALSYVWGAPEPQRSLHVIVDGEEGSSPRYRLPVTASLHGALLSLRNAHMDRVVWADAVCINQRDNAEKAQQIRCMADIYRQAARVIVWLGEPVDGGDAALHRILAAVKDADEIADREAALDEGEEQQILALLQRPWFERVWVLQEVAAARSITVKCGGVEVDGHGFGAALSGSVLGHLYERFPGVSRHVRPVAYLIRGAAFRSRGAPDVSTAGTPRSPTSPPSSSSQGIRQMGELVDMYRSHKASVRHDRIFALLGMSHDGQAEASLSPDYGVPWELLFARLVRFLTGTQVSIQTWPAREVAVISGRATILGNVVAVDHGPHGQGDQQRAHVSLCDLLGTRPRFPRLGHGRGGEQTWDLPPSADPIQVGDIICQLDGAAGLSILRLRQGPRFWLRVVMLAIPRPRLAPDGRDFPSRHLFLVWDWEEDSLSLSLSLSEGETTVASAASQTAEELQRMERLEAIASVLQDVGDYSNAIGVVIHMKNLLTALQGGGTAAMMGVLAMRERLAAIYQAARQWELARDELAAVILSRMQVQGAAHVDTMQSRSRLAVLLRDWGALGPQKLDVMERIILTSSQALQEEDVIGILRSCDEEVVSTLLGLRPSSDRKVTEKWLLAAAGNTWRGEPVMRCLLSHADDGDVIITDAVVAAAAGNEWQGKFLIPLLLERRPSWLKITKPVLAAAMANSLQGAEIWRMLQPVADQKRPARFRSAALMVAMGNWPQITLQGLWARRRRHLEGETGLLTLPPPVRNYPLEDTRLHLHVVAVHGVNGDRIMSWTHESPAGSKVLWLNELLPYRIHGVQAMTFGYAASILGGGPWKGVDAVASALLSQLLEARKREGNNVPVVFLGHDLGGIVIKQALIMANEEPRFAELARWFRGVVFFGTPHRGIQHGFKRWSLLAGAPAAVGVRVNTKLLKTLRPGSEELTYLSESFRFFAPRYGIATFYESSSSNKTFVERHSAVLGVENEDAVALSNSHPALCKFDSLENLDFCAVWSTIRAISHERGTPTSTSSEPILPPPLSITTPRPIEDWEPGHGDFLRQHPDAQPRRSHLQYYSRMC